MKDTKLIIGKKNTGKTRKFLFEEVNKAIENKENLCIFSARDEYYNEFSEKLINNGYNTLLLNLSDPSKSNGFNPLLVPYKLYKEGKTDISITMVNEIGLNIFKEENPYADPFWANMSANYFTGLVLLLFKEGNLDEINIGSVQVMMSQSEDKLNDSTYLASYLEKLDVTNIIYTLLSPTVFAPYETRASIVSSARQKLNKYILREQMLNLLNTNDIDLSNLDNKTAIIIIGESKSNDIANILLDQLMKMNLCYTYILDSFSELKYLENFKDLLKDATYNANKVFVSIYNESQLKENYGKYILDYFDECINANETIENKDAKFTKKKNVNYPHLEMKKHSYINLKMIVDNK